MLSLLIAAVMVFSSAALADGPIASIASVESSSEKIDTDLPAWEMLDKAVLHAKAGEFADAARWAQAGAKAYPSDSRLTKADKLLATHLDRIKKNDQERQEQFETAVRRVNEAMIAEGYLPEPTKAEKDDGKDQASKETVDNQKTWADRLRETINDSLIEEYNNIATGESIVEADSEAAADFRKQSLKALDAMDKALDKARGEIKENDSKYAEILRGHLDDVEKTAAEFRKVWKEAKFG
ncbi:MAG: hypothetical protein ACLFVU_14490, partial [Phycisphaerae bacterium]